VKKLVQALPISSQLIGVLQVDGYGAYKMLAARGEVHLAFCWSHVRRPFYELAQSGPAPIASEALTRIAALYRIEADIRGRSADERRAIRQERSRPLVEALQPWLREKLSLISQKTKLAEAIRYALSRWAGLCLFLEDGRIEIDNNAVERAIRPLALNRKNALFAGSDGGAEHWAVIASLIETCKLLGVEPHGYLADVITRIVNGHPQSRFNDLLPWVYRKRCSAGTFRSGGGRMILGVDRGSDTCRFQSISICRSRSGALKCSRVRADGEVGRARRRRRSSSRATGQARRSVPSRAVTG